MTADNVPRVFISYTGEDLAQHAAVVRDVIVKRRWIPVDHKDWAAGPQRSVTRCLDEVRGCDLLVVLSAHRLGWVPTVEQDGDGQSSIVGLEVAAARAGDIPVLAFVIEDGTAWPVKHIQGLGDPAVLAPLHALQAELRECPCAFFQQAPESVRPHAQQSFEDARPLVVAASATSPAPASSGATPQDTSLLDSYRAWLVERYGEVRLLGFGEQFKPVLPIDSLYVPLQAMTARSVNRDHALGKSDKKRLEEAEYVEENVPITEAIRRAVQLRLQGVALVGDPGAGKTTVARRLCWEAATSVGADSLGLPPGSVPVLIRLRRLRTGDERRTLRAFVTREIASWCGTGEGQLDQDGDALADALWRHPAVFWLFDGLDEVSDKDSRARVSAWIRAHRSRPKHTQHRYVVTCRYAGYQDDARLGERFLDMHVQPLSREQQDEFVRRWYDTVEAAVGGLSPTTEAAAWQFSAALSEVLCSRRFTNQRLASMAANPLLLSVLCLVHRKGDELPKRRSLLYDECVKVLLEHWRHEWRAAQDMESLDLVTARALLEPLAWWLHQQDGRSDGNGVEIVEQALAGTIRTLGSPPDLSAGGLAFLERVRDDAGLLVTPDPGRFGFLHLTFQEYLAAQHAVKQNLAAELASHFDDEWWREVSLLALGEAPAAFATAYFEQLLRTGVDGHANALSLVLDEALHVPIGLLLEQIEAGSVADQQLLLSLLVGRKDEGLIFTARQLCDSADAQVASLAEQVLTQAGAAIPARPRCPSALPRVHAIALDKQTGIVLVSLPAGPFRMGSNSRDDEKPVHEVRVSPFQLAQHPLTNEQYHRFLAATGHAQPALWTNPRFNHPRQPVVGVSWEDAQAFCEWAGMRLPSEAEWEYACRAGTHTEYSFGNDYRDRLRHAWFDADWQTSAPHPSGERLPNPWQLHDMHGNVWEWCMDTWYGTYGSAPSDGSARLDSGTDLRVMRGGSWNDSAQFCRSAARYRRPPGDRSLFVGFRPAKSLP